MTKLEKAIDNILDGMELSDEVRVPISDKMDSVYHYDSEGNMIEHSIESTIPKKQVDKK